MLLLCILLNEKAETDHVKMVKAYRYVGHIADAAMFGICLYRGWGGGGRLFNTTLQKKHLSKHPEICFMKKIIKVAFKRMYQKGQIHCSYFTKLNDSGQNWNFPLVPIFMYCTWYDKRSGNIFF